MGLILLLGSVGNQGPSAWAENWRLVAPKSSHDDLEGLRLNMSGLIKCFVFFFGLWGLGFATSTRGVKRKTLYAIARKRDFVRSNLDLFLLHRTPGAIPLHQSTPIDKRPPHYRIGEVAVPTSNNLKQLTGDSFEKLAGDILEKLTGDM